MLLLGRGWLLVLGMASALGAGAASAENLDAGKSAAALFSSNCTACHKSPAGLAKGNGARSVADFLRQHYTTGSETANALAAYVTSFAAPSAEPSRRGRQNPRLGNTDRPGVETDAPRRRPAAVEPDAPDQKPRRTARPVVEPGSEKLRPSTKRRARPETAAPAERHVAPGSDERIPLSSRPDTPVRSPDGPGGGRRQTPAQRAAAPEQPVPVATEPAAAPPAAAAPEPPAAPRSPAETPDQPAFSVPSP